MKYLNFNFMVLESNEEEAQTRVSKNQGGEEECIKWF
jgi:hypothetical protein